VQQVRTTVAAREGFGVGTAAGVAARPKAAGDRLLHAAVRIRRQRQSETLRFCERQPRCPHHLKCGL
ncbi:hypothetical protein FRC00_011709, partial [Tulasnella sp. 408]